MTARAQRPTGRLSLVAAFRGGCPCATCGDEVKSLGQLDAEREEPQAAFWRHRYRLKKPGASWTLTGHSRALVRTGFYIEELKVFLDAGVAWRNQSPSPNLICITHTHIDHCNALPMLLRTEARPAILAPRDHMPALKEMADMTWSVKRPGWDPTRCQPLPLREDATYNCSIDQCGVEVGDRRNTKRWIGALPGDAMSVPQLKGFSLRVVRCFHTIEDVGYVLCEATSSRQGVDEQAEEELRQVQEAIEAAAGAAEKRAAGRRIGEMMRQGRLREVTAVAPRLAFLCDTTVQVFGACAACRAGEPCEFVAEGTFTPGCGDPALLEEQAQLLFQCTTIVVECSFLAIGSMDEAAAEAEARARGHVAWTQLRPVVEAHGAVEFVLVHFSKRYTDRQIRAFFATASSSGGPVPNVLLWLDEGLSRGEGEL